MWEILAVELAFFLYTLVQPCAEEEYALGNCRPQPAYPLAHREISECLITLIVRITSVISTLPVLLMAAPTGLLLCHTFWFD